MAGLLTSKNAQEKQLGQLLTGLEYENLYTALELALTAQVSILKSYSALSFYIDVTQDQQRGLELGQMVLRRLEDYPAETLGGPLGAEFVGVLDYIASRQLLTQQYALAEASYQKALALTNNLENDELREKLKAGMYHQLGMVAEEQRQWAQAEQYYQQALQIFIEYQDRYRQASTYHQLGRVAEAQRQWAQAEQYYQQALQIKIEYQDRYSQASTYHQLGRVAQEQQQWKQAQDYLLKDLEISTEFNDEHGMAITLRSLARLWQAQPDESLLAGVGAVLNLPAAEVRALLEGDGS